MNILKTYTVPTPQAGVFLVYWTNSSTRPRGALKVHITNKVEDASIAAELAAMQFLLEEKRVIGTNMIGSHNTKFTVSQGAIRKLERSQSDKRHLAPYADFLTTRFSGCQLCVEKDSQWFEGLSLDAVEDLIVNEPHRELIRLSGLGDVSVTQHVLDRFTDRFLADTAPNNIKQKAWKKLIETASDPMLREVSRPGFWTSVKYARQNRHEGRYFLNSRSKLILVVTDNPGEGKRLVTVYPISKQFVPAIKNS
jgi:hypothetical protein